VGWLLGLETRFRRTNDRASSSVTLGEIGCSGGG
jgi:hypothetical protein